MTDQDKAPGQSDDTDTGGHIYRRSADAESAERDDTEGHMPFSRGADADSAEGDTDTEGHINSGARNATTTPKVTCRTAEEPRRSPLKATTM
jgi:hypothetical protein